MQTSIENENNAQSKYDRLNYLMSFSEWTIRGTIKHDSLSSRLIVLVPNHITSMGMEELRNEFGELWFSEAFGGFVF